MRFGSAGTRWAQARNAQYCPWSQAFNASFTRGASSAASRMAGAEMTGGFAFPFGSMHNYCDYVPYAQRLPDGLLVSSYLCMSV